MKNKYIVVKSKIIVDGLEVTSFGIKGAEKILYDISTDYGFVKNLTTKLNKNDVSESHFEDVIEDSL